MTCYRNKVVLLSSKVNFFFSLQLELHLHNLHVDEGNHRFQSQSDATPKVICDQFAFVRTVKTYFNELRNQSLRFGAFVDKKCRNEETLKFECNNLKVFSIFTVKQNIYIYYSFNP